MKQLFDVLILDVTCPFEYEEQTLQVRGVGGTEASVIRLAEGFGFLGLRVAVMQHNRTMPVMGTSAYYLPMSMIDEVDCINLIMLRGCQYVEKFPKATKFSWHEDVPNEIMLHLKPLFIEHDVTVVGASKWHKGAIQELICNPQESVNPKVTYVYNPVPDHLFVPKETQVKYDKNKLVWLASPHKGLAKAISLFERLVDVSGNKDFRLHIFNPGYFANEDTQSPYVINHGSVPCAEIWQQASESLCVFYPTSFKETFGCIAAEANAVHTPLLTHEIAALGETVSGHGQFVKADDTTIINTVVKWYNGERPEVYGQNRFRTSEVIPQWIKMFRKKNAGLVSIA